MGLRQLVPTLPMEPACSWTCGPCPVMQGSRRPGLQVGPSFLVSPGECSAPPGLAFLIYSRDHLPSRGLEEKCCSLCPCRFEKKSESEVAQSCPTLCDPVGRSLPGSSVHGILQARKLGSVAISFSRGSSRPRDQTRISRTAGRCFNL